jgi:hypothetical protein
MGKEYVGQDSDAYGIPDFFKSNDEKTGDIPLIYSSRV